MTSKFVSPSAALPVPTEKESEYVPMARLGAFIVYLIFFSPIEIGNLSKDVLLPIGVPFEEKMVQFTLQLS